MAAEANVSVIIDTMLKNDDFKTNVVTLAKAAGETLSTVTETAQKAAGTLGKAVEDVAKSAISTYGDYEGLVSQTQALFGDSADTVQAYAMQAYQTAGLSANEYLQAVTGFSDALLESLGGDTAQAATAAGMAMGDMADNAGRMSGGIEAAQKAYQGFADGNYSMLDSLRLGYAGTKEEMERLLADASALSGVQYDIGNLGDVYTAIHVVQEEMGLTGTAAQTMGESLTGSVDGMQAAWENLLIGLADGNQDMDGLVQGLLDSAMAVAEQLLPQIETLLLGVVPLLGQVVPQLAEALPGIVAEYAPILLTAAAGLLTGLVQGIYDNRETLLNAAQEIVTTLLEGIGDVVPVLSPITDALGFIIENFGALLPVIVAVTTAMVAYKAAMMISATIAAVQEGMAAFKVASEGATVAQTLLNAVMNANPFMVVASVVAGLVAMLMTLGVTTDDVIAFVQNAWNGLKEFFGGVAEWVGVLFGETIPNAILGAIEWFATLPEKFCEVGGNIVSGIWEGICAKAAWLKEQVSGFFSGVVSDVKELLGIHSPSRVFAEIGGYAIAGFVEGVDSSAEENEGGMLETVAALADGMATGLSGSGAESGLALMQALTASANSALGGVAVVAGNTADTFCNTLAARRGSFYSVGAASMAGLNEGLRVQGQQAIETARGIADAIIMEMQRALDIHSPSRKLRDLVGKPAAQGFLIGFEDEMAHFHNLAQASIDGETGKISANAAAQADGRAAAVGITREVHSSTNTVEKVATVEGDGVTGELVRLLGLKIKVEDRRNGPQLDA